MDDLEKLRHLVIWYSRFLTHLDRLILGLSPDMKNVPKTPWNLGLELKSGAFSICGDKLRINVSERLIFAKQLYTSTRNQKCTKLFYTRYTYQLLVENKTFIASY